MNEIIIFLTFFAMHITLFAIGGGVLLLRRHEQRDRTRIMLGTFMLFMSICIISFIIEGLLIPGGFEEFFRMSLPAYPMVVSFFVWLLLPCYLIEMIRPYWLSWRRLFLTLSPQLILIIIFLIWHAAQGFCDYTPIYTFKDIVVNITKTDVILRVLLAIMYFFTGLIVFFISKDWRRSNAPQPWFNVLAILCPIFGITFILGLIMRIPIFMLLHYLCLDTFCVIALYIEFRVRIPVPHSIAQESISESNRSVDNYCPPELIKNLQDLIDKNFWKNTELQQGELCSNLGTNRTYLANAIHMLGYANYTDMINQLRAQYIHRALKKDPSARLLDLFFEAGFRNRSTACRAFQQLYGCLPSDYQKNLMQDENSI